MATLYKKRNSPNWFAQYFTAEGKRVSKSTRTPKKREAERLASTFEAAEHGKRDGQGHLPVAFAKIVDTAAVEAASGQLTLTRTDELIRRLHRLANPKYRVVTLSDYLESWVQSQANHVTEKTANVYMDSFRRITRALGAQKSAQPIDDLSRSDIETALAKILRTRIKGTSRTITAATANMDLRALRRALRDAMQEGLAKANVAEGIRPLPQSDSSERAPFTAQEVRTLIDHPDTSDEWRGLIIMAAHTGLRLGDLVRLSHEHVTDDRVVIRPAKSKTKRRTVVVPLTPPCLSWIGERNGHFFPTLRALPTPTLSTQFSRLMKKAGIPREVVDAGEVLKLRSFHSLRHSFASWLAEADVHADIRQKLTGHQSAGVHGLYSHHDQTLDRAVKLLPKI